MFGKQHGKIFFVELIYFIFINDNNTMLISTIKELKEKKQRAEENFFRDIMEQIHRTIFFSIEKDEKGCFFKVPLFRLNQPMVSMAHIVKHIKEELQIHQIEVQQISGDHIFLNWNKCSDPQHMTKSMLTKATDNVSALNAMIENYKHYL